MPDNQEGHFLAIFCAFWGLQFKTRSEGCQLPSLVYTFTGVFSIYKNGIYIIYYYLKERARARIYKVRGKIFAYIRKKCYLCTSFFNILHSIQVLETQKHTMTVQMR